ncbi:MAG: three-Cys-motif partner protein TcmP [Anaerolineales bacterium]|nr:three-Cys-motif partner protein TcmP [Anaerolineales bacterium]
MQQRQQFGGDWTEEKLARIEKYLGAYTKILSKQPFRFAYIDAFAGTGYRQLKQENNPAELMFPELAGVDSQKFLEGSAQIALRIRPKFTKYIFIEKDIRRFAELERLKAAFPEVEADIILVNADCNAYLQDLCLNHNWKTNRAVLFLDPFGMQVAWETIGAIAATKAIDLWLLFPLGVAVNRLLRRDGLIDQGLRRRLDMLFGTTDWFDVFYKTEAQQTLFGEEIRLQKTTNLDQIGRYFVSRLKEIFVEVAEEPLPLYNSRNANRQLRSRCWLLLRPEQRSKSPRTSRERQLHDMLAGDVNHTFIPFYSPHCGTIPNKNPSSTIGSVVLVLSDLIRQIGERACEP